MLDDLNIELEALKQAGLYREFSPARRLPNRLLEYRGKKVIDFSSWDFLGVQQLLRLRRAAQTTIEATGLSARASRLSSGTSDQHLLAEDRLAKFLGCEAALLFSSKNQAALSLITNLATERDVVVADEYIHNPIKDAAYLAQAEIRTFHSADLSQLEKLLESLGHFRRIFVCVESVSPLDGSEVELSALATLCAKYGAQLIIDESFALTVRGARGAGVSEEAHLAKNYLCQLGDLSTGLCCNGGFVAGPRVLIDYLANRSATFRSEIAPPPSFASALQAVLDHVELQTLPREQLRLRCAHVRNTLQELRLAGVANSASPIISIRLAKRQQAFELSQAFLQKGVHLEALPLGLLRQEGGILRILLSCEHSDKQIENLLQLFAEIKQKIDES